MTNIVSPKLLSWRANSIILIVGALMISPNEALPSASTMDTPGVAVRTSDGAAHVIHNWRAVDQERFEAENEVVHCRIGRTHDGHWELHLTARKPLQSFSFPFMNEKYAAGGDLSDDFVLSTYLMGVATKADQLLEWGWRGVPYPGTAFAPLVIMCDSSHARLVAATNWPPVAVKPMYSLGRVQILYETPVSAGETVSRKAMIIDAESDDDQGASAWTLAAAAFRDWLTLRLAEEGLTPWPDPDWLIEADGWINIQLENMVRFDPEYIIRQWQRWRDYFPWIQFWGQMSDYADPKRTSEEQGDLRTGCCVDRIELHPRYINHLPDLNRRFSEQGRVGMYVRPRDPYRRLDLADDPHGDRAFVEQWIDYNQRKGAKITYLDVVGARDFGDPLTLARWLRKIAPSGLVIEYCVDVYPAASLISGSLFGGDLRSGPDAIIGRLNGEEVRPTFPQLGRYLLPDRPMWLGQCNGDHQGWGRQNGYWTERQAFLLGAKFDAISIEERNGRMNAAMYAAIQERRRVGWWPRRPRYLHRDGLTLVPPGSDIRRFEDKRGRTLLAVVRESQSADTDYVICEGRRIAIPPGGPIQIVEAP